MPYLSDVNWYQLVKGYWFFHDEALTEEEVETLRTVHRALLDDVQAYAAVHPHPRLRDTIKAWAAARGMPLAPGLHGGSV
jgi:hypothetical protein